jgi:hypothetical protein
MKISLKPILLSLTVATIICSSGCAITNETSLIVGNVRQATNPSDIKLYTKPPANYEEIALISADSVSAAYSKQKLLDIAMSNLKIEATKVGANGILLESAGDANDGGSNTVFIPDNNGGGTAVTSARNTQKVTGVAIFVIAE